MKIALVTLTRGKVSGGFRKYLDHLVPLLRAQSGVEVEVFVPAQMAGAGERSWPERDELRRFRVLKQRVAEIEPDVVFIPTARTLRVGLVPVVMMVRNMEPLEVPFGGNTILEGFKNIARATAARSACRDADRVIAVSRHVHRFLTERWRVPADRVGMVYHGVDPASGDVEPPAAANAIAGRRFLFTAGSIRPARGLEDVIRAMSSVPEGVDLMIAGSVDRGAEHYEAAMRKLAGELGVSSRIVWAGQLDARAMAWCFRNAEAFVMTSRAEACPNVVLEALTQGSLSISTTHPPMPEFFEDAAVYYRERDSGSLAARIMEILAVPVDERHRRKEAARARAALYPWAATARATIEELRLAMGAKLRHN